MEDVVLQCQAYEEKIKKLTQEMQCDRHNLESVKTSLGQKVRFCDVMLFTPT